MSLTRLRPLALRASRSFSVSATPCFRKGSGRGKDNEKGEGGKEEDIDWDSVNVKDAVGKFLRRSPPAQPVPFPSQINYIGNLRDDQALDGSQLNTYGLAIMEQAEEVVKYQELEEGEFPLLAQFAQPYQPPKESAILRIRTIDYLGEKHPLEYKVVLQVSPSKLGLTPTQLHKFLILAGPRYDPIRKELKISSERYQNRTMNLKWASNTLDRLIAEAKDPKETFADVPLTFPHSKPKPSYPFPSEWRMSKGEAEELKESWKAIEEEQLVETTEMEGEGEVKVEEQQLPSSDGPSSPQAS